MKDYKWVLFTCAFLGTLIGLGLRQPIYGDRLYQALFACLSSAMLLVFFAVELLEQKLKNVALMELAQKREEVRYQRLLDVALTSTDADVRKAAFSAAYRLGFTKVAVDEVYQTFSLDQLTAGFERESANINLDKPEF